MIELMSQLMNVILLVAITLFFYLFLKGKKFNSSRRKRNIVDTRAQGLNTKEVDDGNVIKNKIKHFLNSGSTDRTMILPQGRLDVYTATGVKTVDLCLNEKFSFRIGSSPECELVINNPYISKVHAEIFMDENGRLAIEDCSLNGTFLDSEDTSIEAVYLETGMELSLAKVIKIVFFNGFQSPSYMRSNKEAKRNENSVNEYKTNTVQDTIQASPIPKKNELN